jgi:hypothetical protein
MLKLFINYKKKTTYYPFTVDVSATASPLGPIIEI